MAKIVNLFYPMGRCYLTFVLIVKILFGFITKTLGEKLIRISIQNMLKLLTVTCIHVYFQNMCIVACNFVF